MLAAQAKAAEIYRRLRNPPNGRFSTELDVVSPAEQRRREFAKLAAEAFEKQRRRQELLQAFVDAHKRTQFQWRPFMTEDGVRVITFEQIAKTVCQHYKQPRLHVFSQRRSADLVRPRQVIMYLAREHTALSLPAIGRLIGDRDHTTALHGATKIKTLIEAGDEGLIAAVTTIRSVLGVTA